MESWISLGRKEDQTNIQISKNRNLTTVPTTPAQNPYKMTSDELLSKQKGKSSSFNTNAKDAKHVKMLISKKLKSRPGGLKVKANESNSTT